jgi:hypothetical protein
MDHDENHELESSSSLRTQLIEAQILDSRLEGKESDSHSESFELIAKDYTGNISDNAVNENSMALKEIDDTIIRLQEWHLKRESDRKIIEDDMLKSIDFEKEQAIESNLDSFSGITCAYVCAYKYMYIYVYIFTYIDMNLHMYIFISVIYTYFMYGHLYVFCLYRYI